MRRSDAFSICDCSVEKFGKMGTGLVDDVPKSSDVMLYTGKKKSVGETEDLLAVSVVDFPMFGLAALAAVCKHQSGHGLKPTQRGDLSGR